ncbi:MAG: ABC transporter permease [Bacteriovoracaceae bacterium]
MKKTFFLFLLVCLFLLCIFPFVYLGKTLIWTEGHLDLSIFGEALQHSLTLISIRNSVVICTLTVLVSTLISLPLAWLLTRSSLSKKGYYRTLFSLPYAIPPFIGAIAWINLANPSNGFLKTIFPWINIYSGAGLVFATSAFFYTFILINLLSALEKIDPSLEEAARISGATPFQVFTKITLPLVTPSLVTGMLLTFLSAIASFGVPALIGNPAGISMMTTQIYTLQKMASAHGLKLSGALSVILLLISSSVFILDYWVAKKFRYSLVSGKASRTSHVELGKWSLPAHIFLFFLSLVLFFLPIGAILISSLSKLQGDRHLSNFGFQNFETILFHTDETYRALSNSLILAFTTAILCTLFAYALAQGGKSLSGTLNKFKEAFIAIPYAVPGTVLALSMTLTVLAYKLPLYNTIGIILVAYMAKFLNFSYRSINDGIAQIDDSLIDAARVAGANSWQRLVRIWLPLLRPFLMASLFLVFMPAFSELTMTVLLTGPGNETIGTLIFQLQEYGDASGGGAAVLSFLTLILIIATNWILKLSTKGKYGL